MSSDRAAGGLDGNWNVWDGALVAGISGGYSEAEAGVDDPLSSADIESAHVGLYAAWDDSRLRLSGAAAYGFHEIETTRRIVFPGIDRTAEAAYDGDSMALAREAAYRFRYGGYHIGSLATVD